MHRIIGVTDLQRRFCGVLDEVVADHVPYVERNATYGDDEIAVDVEAAIAEVRNTPTRR